MLSTEQKREILLNYSLLVNSSLRLQLKIGCLNSNNLNAAQCVSHVVCASRLREIYSQNVRNAGLMNALLTHKAVPLALTFFLPALAAYASVRN